MSEASEDASGQAIPAAPASLPGLGKRRGGFYPRLSSSGFFQFEDDASDGQTLATRETPVIMPELAHSHGELLIPPKLSLRPQGLLWPKTGQATNASQSLRDVHEQSQNGYALPKISPEQVERPQPVRLMMVEQPDEALLNTGKSALQDTTLPDMVNPVSGNAPVFDLEKRQLQKDGPLVTIDDDPEFEKRSTLPMMVLQGISDQQGKKQVEMKAEVSGAAGAAGMVGIGNIIGSILKYGSTFIIQYSLGPGLYGLYTLSFSLITLVSSIFSLGLDNAMIRYVAIYRGKKQADSLQGLMVFCTMVVGIAGLIGALLMLFFTPSLVAFWSTLRPEHAVNNKATLAQMTPMLQLMAPMIPLLGMQVVWFGGLRGFKAFKWRVLATSILQPIVQIFLLIIMARFFRNVTGVALVMLLSTLFSTLLYLYFLFYEFSRVASTEPEQYELREWLVFSTLNFLTNIIITVLDSIDTLLLAFYGISKIDIGQYGAAIKFGPIITMPLLSLNIIFAPIIAELHSKGERQKLEEMFKIVTKWAITFSLPLFLIASLFSAYLLGLSGAGYISAWPLVIAFSLGNMLGAATGSVGSMLLMTGHNKLSFINSLLAVVVNVVLGILLTPRYGAMGTALSTGLAVCVLNIMRLVQVGVVLKMQPYRWDTLKPLGAGLLSSAITGTLLYLLSHASIHDSFILGHAVISLELGLIPVFIASYVGVLILLKLDPADEIVLNALRKKFHKFGIGKKKKSKNKKQLQQGGK
jgi:O-antigen/teichoic acid export membrane protein